MPNTKEKGKLIEVLSKHIPYGHATLCLIAEELMAEGVTFATDNNVGDKWISVKDRLPDQMGKYLCRYVFGNEEEYPFEQVLWYYTAVEKPHFQHEGSMGMRVTHWMPLPQPPKGE